MFDSIRKFSKKIKSILLPSSKKSDGCVIILVIFIIQLVIKTIGILESENAIEYHFINKISFFWSNLYVLFIFILCRILVYLANKKKFKDRFSFFLDFDILKGIVIFLFPYTLWFIYLLTKNPAEALSIHLPFTGFMIAHASFIVVFIVFFLLFIIREKIIGSIVRYFFNKKERDSNKDTNFFSITFRDLFIFPAILSRVKTYGAKSRYFATFVIVSYVIFFLLTACSLLIPKEMFQSLQAKIVTQKEFLYVIPYKYGARFIPYCEVKLIHDSKEKNFYLSYCIDCLNNQVRLTYNPIDHFSRRNIAQCTEK